MAFDDKADLKIITATNLLWKFSERFGAQCVSIVVSIILARLLEPENYGVIAIVSVFMSILEVFIDSGLGNALIQKKNADNLDFSTVFYISVLLCGALYSMLFAAAPYIAAFYRIPQLCLLVRVLGITLFISSVRNILQAYVARHLIFKMFFYSTACGMIVSAVIGVTMAFQGYGVWALVAQQLSNSLIGTLILWLAVRWRPCWSFSFRRFKSLFSYGGRLFIAQIVSVVYNDLAQLIIGKIYTPAELAFYNKGSIYPNKIVGSINTSIDAVLFPILSKSQDDFPSLKSKMRRSIKTSSFIMWPMMIGLSCIGYQFILLLLTEKWLPCLPFLYIFCFTRGIVPVHTTNLNAIKAVGRSDIILRLEIIKKIVGVLMIMMTANISVLAIGFGLVVSSIFASFINAYYSKKLFDYSFREQLLDTCPALVMSVIMGGAVLLTSLLPFPLVITFCMQILVGFIIYFLLCVVTKNETFLYILNLFKTLRQGKKDLSGKA